MKKYQQLILTILAITGTVFFIFYKHEYNRLRAVLQVLDTFGSEAVANSGKNCKNDINRTYSSHIQSSWRQISDLYIISATVRSSNVEILSVSATFNDLTEKCLIWHEKEEKATEGRMSVQFIDENNKFNKIAIIKCKMDTILSNIYGVTLITSFEGENHHFVPVLRPKKLKNERKIGICTLFDEKPYRNLLEIAEFVEFHRIFGVTHFYFYSDSLEPNVLRILDEFQMEFGLIRIYIIHWSPPVINEITKEFERLIFANDCLMRSRLEADYVAILNVTEIFFPKFHEKLENIVKDVEQVDSKPRAFLQFYCRFFCLDFVNNELRSELPLKTLRAVWWQRVETGVEYGLINCDVVEYISFGFVLIYDKSSRNYLVPSDVATIHKYVNCGSFKSKLKPDKIGLNFKNILIQNGVIKSILKRY